MTGYFSHLFNQSSTKNGVTGVISVTGDSQINADKGLSVTQPLNMTMARRVTDVTQNHVIDVDGYTQGIVTHWCNSVSVTHQANEIKTSLPSVTQVTPLHHEIEYLRIAIEERAAFIEHEGNIPREWAEAFARMELMRRPASIPQHRWQTIINNTGILLDKHIHDLIKHGWTTQDVFGVHLSCPHKRYDSMGLLYLLKDSEVHEIKDSSIRLQTSTGGFQVYRKPIYPSQEQIFIWQINHGENNAQ